jgi:hypothetical protein
MAMRFEVLVIRGDSVGAVENGEKIGEQVDEHQRPGRGWAARVLLKPGGMIVRLTANNKR